MRPQKPNERKRDQTTKADRQHVEGTLVSVVRKQLLVVHQLPVIGLDQVFCHLSSVQLGETGNIAVDRLGHHLW